MSCLYLRRSHKGTEVRMSIFVNVLTIFIFWQLCQLFFYYYFNFYWLFAHFVNIQPTTELGVPISRKQKNNKSSSTQAVWVLSSRNLLNWITYSYKSLYFLMSLDFVLNNVHFSHLSSICVSCNLSLCVIFSIMKISSTVSSHCSWVGGFTLPHFLVIDFFEYLC